MKEINKSNEIIKVGNLDIAITRFGKGLPVLCFHGWLDNAASFYPLIEELNLPNLQFISVDFPGHGLSEHRMTSENQYFIDLLVFIFRLYDALGIDQAILMGHSMGAGASSMFAGAFPEMVTQLVLIDGLGPVSDKPGLAVRRVRENLLQEKKTAAVKNRVYPDFQTAVKIRMRSGPISENSAKVLVERGMKKTENGYIWNYDTRLKAPSVIRLVEQQVASFIKKITSPTTLILASDSNLRSFGALIDKRINYVKNIQVHRLTGGHHLHMDNCTKVSSLLRPVFL